MKLATSMLLLLCLVPAAFGAEGDLGAACKAADPKCNDANAHCNTAENKCVCKPNFVQKGTACVPMLGEPCGIGQCASDLICAADSSSTPTCQSCPAGKFIYNNKCVEKIGGTCTTDTDCGGLPGTKCMTRSDSSKKCTCDTSKNFDDGTDGTTTQCSCKPGHELKDAGTCGKIILTCTTSADCEADKVCDSTTKLCGPCPANTALKSDKTCGKVIGQTCSNAADCIDGAKCDTTCKCDDTKNFVSPGNDGDTSCLCSNNYALRLDMTCGKVIGQSCSTGDCIDGAKCDGGTSLCACDADKNLEVDTAGTGCKCVTDTVPKSDGSCGKLIGATCGANTECIDGAKCGASGTGNCICDDAKNLEVDTAGTGCKCKSNHAMKEDGTCGKVIGQSCSAGECIDGATCSSSKCACDMSKNFAEGQDGATSCSCKTDYALRDYSTGCGIKAAGTSCTSASDCGKYMLCTNGYCECDASKNFEMKTTVGDIGKCGCKANYEMKADGTCGKVIGQTCTSDSQCIDHAICKDENNVKTCKCDTTKNFAAGNADDTSCDCAPNYAFKFDRTTCGKAVGQSCENSWDCEKFATCDPVTKNCVCDDANGFKAAASGSDPCDCKSGYTVNQQTGGRCGKASGQTCSLTCSSMANCNSTYGFCQCEASAVATETFTCRSGVSAVVFSVFLTLLGLVTSRLA